VDAHESLKGNLLVASPALLDPNFRRTVVLVTEHTEEGAMGLVLNRAADATLAEVVPGLATLPDAGAPVHVGGPVQPSAVVVLAEFDDPDDAAAVVVGDVGFMSAETDPADLERGTRRVRAFAGYAGWAAGQLDEELVEESWIVEPALPDDPFTTDPDGLWSAVLRRKGGRYALVASMPLDPSQN
jgi:putative transcriptional regulator